MQQCTCVKLSHACIIVLSFLELIPLLLAVPNVEYVLSERFCQDPLESFFGKQRYHGGWNDNPSVKQFIENSASIHVQGSAALAPLRGNIYKSGRLSTPNDIVDSAPLPKRRRISK